MNITVHNCETGEVVERPMNAEELAQWEKNKAHADNIKKIEADKTAKREALLQKLGITEDEARLLLG